MKNFEFNIGARVKLSMSHESGIVKGRAEYDNSQNNYLVLYVAADGRQVSSWLGEDELISA